MRILIISSDVPVTSSMPGSPRTFSLFRTMARRHELHLATFVSTAERYEQLLLSTEHSKVFRTITILPNPQRTSFWWKQRHRLVQAPHFITRYRYPDEFDEIRNQIKELMSHVKSNLVFADGLAAAQYILDCEGIPRVVDAVDAISLNVKRASRFAGSYIEKLRLMLEGMSIRRYEVTTARTVDAYLVSSPIDQQALRGYDDDINVHCIHNGVDTEYFTPSDQEARDKTIVFTGVMGYGPNRDAAHFLCREILPRVLSAVPDVKVEVVGSDPSDDVRALACDNVMVTGTVPDVRPFVHRAAVYVSPLRFGTGVKNKVLSALAMGKAVVATSESVSGLEVTAEEHLLVADTPGEFAGHIVRLLTDSSWRRHLGISGRNFVLERYGWDSIGKKLEALLVRLVFGAAQPVWLSEG